MNRVCAVIFVLFSVTCVVTGFLNLKTPCPSGCAQSTCYIARGCTRCTPSHCLSFTRFGRNTLPFCTPDCGKDKMCKETGILRVCTAKPKTTTPRTRRWRWRS